MPKTEQMSTPFSRLNFHHLHYFWAVAKEGQLTRAARHLNIAQSALSTQIRQLELALGQQLFVRQGRTLVLTEAGRIALAYADTIMATGNELVATLKGGHHAERQALRVGAVATLSRNFQRGFLAPVFSDSGVALVLQSGTLAELLARLQSHSLDVILSNRRVHEDAENAWRCRRIARQQVSLVGPKRASRQAFRFPDDIVDRAMVLPSRDSEIRSAFDVICEQKGVRVNVVAEVDDMAMLRLIARETDAVTLVPAVVVLDELRSGVLEEYGVVPTLYEEFYAITIRRQYQHPMVRQLLERTAEEVLAPMGG